MMPHNILKKFEKFREGQTRNLKNFRTFDMELPKSETSLYGCEIISALKKIDELSKNHANAFQRFAMAHATSDDHRVLARRIKLPKGMARSGNFIDESGVSMGGFREKECSEGRRCAVGIVVKNVFIPASIVVVK